MNYMACYGISHLRPEIQVQCICAKMDNYHILFCQCAVTKCPVYKRKQLQALSINFVMNTQMSAWVAAVQEVMHMCCGMLIWTYTTVAN